jgi:hypothetical protein
MRRTNFIAVTCGGFVVCFHFKISESLTLLIKVFAKFAVFSILVSPQSEETKETLKYCPKYSG